MSWSCLLVLRLRVFQLRGDKTIDLNWLCACLRCRQNRIFILGLCSTHGCFVGIGLACVDCLMWAIQHPILWAGHWCRMLGSNPQPHEWESFRSEILKGSFIVPLFCFLQIVYMAAIHLFSQNICFSSPLFCQGAEGRRLLFPTRLNSAFWMKCFSEINKCHVVFTEPSCNPPASLTFSSSPFSHLHFLCWLCPTQAL